MIGKRLVVRRGKIVDYVWQRHIPSSSDPVDPEVQTVVAGFLRP